MLLNFKDWGMNLPIGGAENRSLTGKKIEANGEHGHMYIYYQSPKKGRFGGLLSKFVCQLDIIIYYN